MIQPRRCLTQISSLTVVRKLFRSTFPPSFQLANGIPPILLWRIASAFD
jgi:hypothetical protein